jgi:hypothetical protein
MNKKPAGSRPDPEEFLEKFMTGLQDSRVQDPGNFALYGMPSDNIATKAATGVIKV